MNVDEIKWKVEKCCGNCKFHKDGLCMNELSDQRIDYTDNTFVCDKWEYATNC